MNRNPDRVFGHDATCGDQNTGFERMRHYSVTASLAVVIKVLIIKDLTYGEPGGTRTRDPVIKSHMLYQLSYRPKRVNCVTGLSQSNRHARRLHSFQPHSLYLVQTSP